MARLVFASLVTFGIPIGMVAGLVLAAMVAAGEVNITVAMIPPLDGWLSRAARAQDHGRLAQGQALLLQVVLSLAVIVGNLFLV